MADKPAADSSVADEVQDLNEMMGLKGRHDGHTLRRVGEWWLCSCAKEVRQNA